MLIQEASCVMMNMCTVKKYKRCSVWSKGGKKLIQILSYDSKRTKDRDPTKLIENSKRAQQKIITVVNACKENKEECYWRGERKTKIVTLVEELKCH